MQRSVLIYRFIIQLYVAVVRIAALWDPKARKWVRGRKGWREKLQAAGMEGCTWFHCASLGEFEQARPLIETIKAADPQQKILLSFFSPSGYEVRQHYPTADLVIYLPPDGPRNAADFLRLAKPSQVVFVRYDTWYFFLREVKRLQIPAILISAFYPAGHWIYRRRARVFREALKAFHTIFVQDDASAGLLKAAGFTSVEVTGDTRIDRVVQLPLEPLEPGWVASWVDGKECWVMGSLWDKDFEVVKHFIKTQPSLKFIVAPHQLHKEEMERWKKYWGKEAFFFSEGAAAGAGKRIMVLDTIGMLNKIYRLGQVAYIGGGFGRGIHNTLEPAVYGLPLIFGPHYRKFPEALYWIEKGMAQSIGSSESFEKAAQFWLNPVNRPGKAAFTAYFTDHSGAVEKIWNRLKNS